MLEVMGAFAENKSRAQAFELEDWAEDLSGCVMCWLQDLRQFI